MSQSLVFQTIAKYSEPWRKFHTMQHLAYLWKVYEEACAENPSYLSHREMLEFLIPFHDWVYVPGYAKNEEDSAEFAHWWLTKIERLDLDTPLSTFGSCQIEEWTKRDYQGVLYRRIPEIILGTKHHLNPKDQLEALFFDMDICGMGSSWEDYLVTSKQITDEYSRLIGWDTFHKGRKAFAESILCREKIYNLPEFQKFDAPTRRNLLKELEETKQVLGIFSPEE